MPQNLSLPDAIIQTVAYADVFDYPLTSQEIHRYLIQTPATYEEIHQTLSNGLICTSKLHRHGDYFTLPGRGEVVETRTQRAARSAQLWPLAISYGHTLARFPFVRMVALTGSLVVDNVEHKADLDYFIVTEPGRLWLCRAMVIGLVRWAARRGIILCPNFFLAENALSLSERTVYTAREVAQMVPLSGMEVYRRIRVQNAWVNEFLPNAHGTPPRLVPILNGERHPAQALIEAVFRTSPGTALEKWEMNRKIRKFSRQHPTTAETRFSPDRCQGHFDGYGKRTMEAFQARLANVSQTPITE